MKKHQYNNLLQYNEKFQNQQQQSTGSFHIDDDDATQPLSRSDLLDSTTISFDPDSQQIYGDTSIAFDSLSRQQRQQRQQRRQRQQQRLQQQRQQQEDIDIIDVTSIKNKVNLLIESKSRDVMTYPNPYDFTINYSTSLIDKQKISNCINPISDAYPYHQWQWNSDLGTTIISGGRGYFNEDGTKSLTGITNPVPTIIQKGTSYKNGTYNVTTTGTNGFGCTLNTTFKNSQLISINKIRSSGSNYKINDILTILGGNNDATVKVISLNGEIACTGGSGTGMTVQLQTGGTYVKERSVSGYHERYYTGDLILCPVEQKDLLHTGSDLINCSFSSTTQKWTKTAHGLSNGDFIIISNFNGQSTDFFFKDIIQYFVVNVDTANTFQLSLNPGGDFVNSSTDLPSSVTLRKISSIGEIANIYHQSFTISNGLIINLYNNSRYLLRFDDSVTHRLKHTWTRQVNTQRQVKSLELSSRTNWSFDFTSGAVEDMWTATAGDHNLQIGDIITFTAQGDTDPPEYSLNKPYYVITVPSSTTVQLSDTNGGSVVEGTADSGGGHWTAHNSSTYDANSRDPVIFYHYSRSTSLDMGGGLNKTDTTITVDSTEHFEGIGIIKIDNELIFYTGKTATTFTGCTRAYSYRAELYDGASEAAEHDDDTLVYAGSFKTMENVNIYKSDGTYIGTTKEFHADGNTLNLHKALKTSITAGSDIYIRISATTDLLKTAYKFTEAYADEYFSEMLVDTFRTNDVLYMENSSDVGPCVHH